MIFDKVYILAPAQSGGVKEVCQSLKKGFEENNLPTQEVSTIFRGIGLAIKSRFSKERSLFITNLQFGIIGIFAKKSIFIIHGYPFYRTEPYYKYKINLIFHFIFSLINTKSVAVSFLTRYICQNHLGINVDSVIQNPLPDGFFIPKACKEKFTIVYIGRIVASKGLDKILSAIDLLRGQMHEKKVIFNVIGDGPLLNNLKDQFPSSDNVFHGFIDVQTKYEIMAKSEIFISLCEGEPFGLTALEANFLKMKCILPVYGGHQEFLDKQLQYCISDIYNLNEIKDALLEAFQTEPIQIELGDENSDIKKYDKKLVAKTYLNLFN
jgi:glycosyltransferase involved in cell wall biosynthesis